MAVRAWLCSSFSRRSHALDVEDEAMALWITARDGVVNLAIVLCLCLIVEVWQGVDFYFDNAAVASLLTKRQFKPSNMREDERNIGLLLPDFSGIVTADMVWDWMDASVVPAFTVPEPRVLISNRLLGKVRLRQVRVRDGTCAMREVGLLGAAESVVAAAAVSERGAPLQLFDGKFTKCFGPYTAANENRDSFWPDGEDGGGTRARPARARTAGAWQWSSAASLGASTSFRAEVETYDGGGFYVDLPRDHDKAVAMLRELRDGRWIDEATRIVIVDVNLYNPDHNVFVLVNAFIEIPPTAGFLPRVQVNTLKLLHDEHCHLTSHVLLLVLSLWTALLQASELAARGLADYLKVIAHYLHSLAAVAGVGVSVYGVVHQCRDPDPDTTPALIALRSDEFVDLLSEREAYDVHRYIVIMLLFLSSSRLLFLSDFGHHSKLTLTLRRSMGNILSFSFMFGILMCSFSMLAYLVFGTDLYDFRTFQNSLFVLVEVITGQLDYESLSTTNRFLGPAFYMAFIFFVVFVLYNMFIVILNESYHSVRKQAAADGEVEKYAVMRFVGHVVDNTFRLLRIPVALPRAEPPPVRSVKLRALRTLLIDCKVPRKTANEFVWQLGSGGEAVLDKDQAARIASRTPADLWQVPASWEYFTNLWHRSRAVEKAVRKLNKALDQLLQDLR